MSLKGLVPSRSKTSVQVRISLHFPGDFLHPLQETLSPTSCWRPCWKQRKPDSLPGDSGNPLRLLDPELGCSCSNAKAMAPTCAESSDLTECAHPGGVYMSLGGRVPSMSKTSLKGADPPLAHFPRQSSISSRCARSCRTTQWTTTLSSKVNLPGRNQLSGQIWSRDALKLRGDEPFAGDSRHSVDMLDPDKPQSGP